MENCACERIAAEPHQKWEFEPTVRSSGLIRSTIAGVLVPFVCSVCGTRWVRSEAKQTGRFTWKKRD
jgi:hypothetical protein